MRQWMILYGDPGGAMTLDGPHDEGSEALEGAVERLEGEGWAVVAALPVGLLEAIAAGDLECPLDD